MLMGLTFSVFLMVQMTSMFAGIMKKASATVTHDHRRQMWVMDPAVTNVASAIPMPDYALDAARSSEGIKLVPGYPCRAVNGASLERWILKILCGSLAAEGEPVPLSWVLKLFAHDDILAPCGLYMHVYLTRRHFAPFGIELGVFRNDEGVSGAVVRLDALSFTLDMVGQGRTVRPNEVGAARLLRPPRHLV
jgi:hypothetical protein